MAEQTQLNYEQMSNIAKTFQEEAEAIQALAKDTENRVGELHGGGWIGRGSNQFYTEMHERILPSMQRLVSALNVAGNSANNICKEFHTAEEECKGFYNNLGEA